MQQAISYAEYDTSAGDTFDELALDFCGNEMYASEIIALNPDYADVLIFGEGITLIMPVYELEDRVETLPPWRDG